SVISLFSTMDGGATWTAVAGNLEQNANGSGNGPSTRWMEILPVGEGTMYLVGTSTGLYSTAYLDGNSTVWVQEGASNIGNVVVEMLDSRESDGLVVAATHGVGVYSANITTLPGVAVTPQLLLPANGKGGITNSVKLEWSSVPGNLYTIEIATDSDFKNTISQAKGISAMSYTVSNLQQGLKTFYWRVRATNEGGPGSYSQTWSFTTAVAAPMLITPKDQLETERNPLLRWETSEGATSYRVQVSRSLGFTNNIIDVSGITAQEFRASELDANTNYHWRVSAANADGEGLFSPRTSFKTTNVTSVWKNENSAIEFLKNYPNPFKNSSTIRFKTSVSGSVSLTVYDVAGRRIATLLEGFKDSGEHTVSFKSDGIPSGKYFVTLSEKGSLKTIPVEIVR
ncbi:MAG TPA: T9SS type A sorting domain-containing protein, partial [Patescibacteria group bacterium]|nr:T9SS type A sorting domain-containing protein [Patescibacteria group bacterium]